MDPWMVEVTKEEIENAMLLPGEYKETDGKYYIKRGMLDGYIEPIPGEDIPVNITLNFLPIRSLIAENFLAIREHIEPEVVSD